MGKKIAITGGIGSGKSTVAALIKEKGFPVFSCDELYAEILEERKYIEGIEKLFPSAVINGRIDRKTLGNIVFANKDELKKLNAIAHPLVMQRLYQKMNESASPTTFAEVPLLFEGSYQDDFDEIIVVMRLLSDRIQSIVKRDGGTSADALAKIRSQFDYNLPENLKTLPSEKIYVINNDQTIEHLKKELALFINKQSL